jgi:hypothetical protein
MTPNGPTGGDPAPPQPPAATVQPSPDTLQAMNGSAQQSASLAQNGAMPCPKKSWFAIRITDEKGAVVEGLTLKLKVPDLGDIDRVTSKGGDPIKIAPLAAGGQAEVHYIDGGDTAWEAVGDIK